MTQIDYERRGPEERREGVSPLQRKIILAWDEDDSMKSEALDALEFLVSGEFLGTIRPIVEDGLESQGLAKDEFGIWRPIP